MENKRDCVYYFNLNISPGKACVAVVTAEKTAVIDHHNYCPTALHTSFKTLLCCAESGRQVSFPADNKQRE